MINIEFRKPQPKYPHGCVRIDITGADLSGIEMPISARVINNIDGGLKWQVNMYINHWAEWYEFPNTTIVFSDKSGKILKILNWDTHLHGDIIHQKFMNWAIINPGKKGIAIGTNDGTTGEWVHPVYTGLLEATLVEASDDTFEKLFNNWKSKTNVSFESSLITTDGGECVFYESTDSYTNTVSKEHLSSLKSNSEIKEVVKQSISINDLISKHGLSNRLDWLHLDVEGIDDQLIMAILDANLPEILVYESLNLSGDRRHNVLCWLNSKGYDCVESNWNTMAIRKN